MEATSASRLLHRDLLGLVLAASFAACSGSALVGENGGGAGGQLSVVSRGTGGRPTVDNASQSVACGVPAKSGAFMPLVVGATWTFRVSDPARDVELAPKTNTIVEDLGDGLVKVRNSGYHPGYRWVQDTGVGYVWRRNAYLDRATQTQFVSDQYYSPDAPRFEYAKTELGETWQRAYEKVVIDVALCPGWTLETGEPAIRSCPAEAVTSASIVETWTVTDVGREVTTEIGTFVAVCHYRSCPSSTQCISGEYCFARGVGKVWEESDEREELTRFCFPSSATE